MSSFQGERSSFGVDTTKAKTTVPWRRCSIANGAIYKKKGQWSKGMTNFISLLDAYSSKNGRYFVNMSAGCNRMS